MLREAQETLWQALCRGARPPQVGQCMVHHEFRENNKAADAMASRAVAERRSLRVGLPQALPWQPDWPWRLSAAFDGGRRGVHAGCGWVIWIQAPDRQSTLLQDFCCLGGRTVPEAELHGCRLVLGELRTLLQCRHWAQVLEVCGE